jgi:NAD-dependent dihydropyrimidine dehydrogenase PreA subunit
MCKFCLEHGKGKKWYHNMENFSEKLLEDKDREEFIRDFAASTYGMPRGKFIRHNLPFASYLVGGRIPVLKNRIDRRLKKSIEEYHFGQVVTLEEVRGILEASHSIALIDCICRRYRGIKDRKYCLALGGYGDYCERIPNSGVEELDVDKAMGLVEKFDARGLYHSVWVFKTPFVGGLCNCSTSCFGYTWVKKGIEQAMLKGHYVPVTDHGKCTLCGECVDACLFSARRISGDEVGIIPEKCMGCGLCESRCEEKAIRMEGVES